MTIKIVFPKAEEGSPKTTYGTRVFNADGTEIKNIYSISIDSKPDSMLTATIEVAIGDVENLYIDDPLFTYKKPSFMKRLKALFGIYK